MPNLCDAGYWSVNVDHADDCLPRNPFFSRTTSLTDGRRTLPSITTRLMSTGRISLRITCRTPLEFKTAGDEIDG